MTALIVVVFLGSLLFNMGVNTGKLFFSRIKETKLNEKISHILFADYLYKTGKDEIAEQEYLTALQYVKNENQKKASFFMRFTSTI